MFLRCVALVTGLPKESGMKGSYEPIGIPYLFRYLFNDATYTQTKPEYFMITVLRASAPQVSRFAFDDRRDRKNC